MRTTAIRAAALARLMGCALACTFGGTAIAQGDDAPAPADAGKARAFETADELLDALEAADASIDRLSAGVRYTKIFAIAGDAQQREGSLRFQLRPRKMFEIEFRTLRMGGEVRDVPQTFVFDGQWFTEVYPDEKLMMHRRVVGDDATIDPFDLEQGPFPMPIGQRKDVILERFDARVAPPREGLDEAELTALGDRADQGNWAQLVLTPLEGVDLADDDGRTFEKLRMWYDPATLLPVLGMSVEPIEGELADVKLLEFFQVRTNDEAAEGQFILDQPPEGEGWDVIYRDDTGGQG